MILQLAAEGVRETGVAADLPISDFAVQPMHSGGAVTSLTSAFVVPFEVTNRVLVGDAVRLRSSLGNGLNARIVGIELIKQLSAPGLQKTSHQKRKPPTPLRSGLPKNWSPSD